MDTFTAKWEDGKTIYLNEPHGNLFGKLPLGALPSKFPGKLASDEEGYDDWDGAEFMYDGKKIIITKD